MLQIIELSFKLFILIVVLALPAFSFLEKNRAQDWASSRPVSLYHFANSRNDTEIQNYLARDPSSLYRNIETFMSDQASRYGLSNDKPVVIKVVNLGDVAEPPKLDSHSWWDRLSYSLLLRLWAWRSLPFEGLGTVQLVGYLNNETVAPWPPVFEGYRFITGPRQIIKLNANAGLVELNSIKFAHHYIRSIGASAKYDEARKVIYPDGYAKPDLKGLYPQILAELSAGLVPLTEKQAVPPMRLNGCMIGAMTAKEIGWSP